mmetsp:Transcript_107951/g.186192  ORF Transcript_107951/g.186192 Transcript_107951/m.186192 type:complete len:84 (-) Transcript_107951:2292-2543(-)
MFWVQEDLAFSLPLPNFCLPPAPPANPHILLVPSAGFEAGQERGQANSAPSTTKPIPQRLKVVHGRVCTPNLPLTVCMLHMGA